MSAVPKRASRRREPLYLRLQLLVDPGTGESRAALVAADPNEAAQLRAKKLKVGQVYRCELHKPRNHAHHRLVFATLGFLVDSCELFDNVEQALNAVKCGMGFFDPMIVVEANGKQRTIYVPRSIAFDAMGEDEFGNFHRDLVRFITKRYVTGMTPEQVHQFLDLTKDTPA